jgi:glycosyltransferase involved in cell wall biosynthesis
MIISIIIRTFNEQRYIGELLTAIAGQQSHDFTIETIIVDSGSTDNTLKIAGQFNCKILHIKQEDFSFGYSLNYGCNAAQGEVLAFISGHCIPTAADWLSQLCQPLVEGQADYVYGRQLSHGVTQFSEKQIFKANYPSVSSIPQNSNFCNNANAAMTKKLWQIFKFDESVTGLEDLDFAQRARENGYQIGYQAASAVIHIHHESWKQIQHRFNREAIALKLIASSSLSLQECFYWFLLACFSDFKVALLDRSLLSNCVSIIKYRYHQFRGLYLGKSPLSHLKSEPKRRYFWPYPIEDKS